MRRVKHALAYAVCALALALVGCAQGADGVRQAVINASATVSAGYKTLEQVEQVVQMRIREQNKTNPRSAALALQEAHRQHDIVRAALDVAKAALPDIDKCAENKTPQDCINAAGQVVLDVTSALAKLGGTP